MIRIGIDDRFQTYRRSFDIVFLNCMYHQKKPEYLFGHLTTKGTEK